MKKYVILFFIAATDFAEEYHTYNMELITKIPNGTDEGEISAWEDPGDTSPNSMIFNQKGELFFSQISRFIISEYSPDIKFKRDIAFPYSYAGIAYSNESFFQSYSMGILYGFWADSGEKISIDIKGKIKRRSSYLFYSMNSFFYDKDNNIYCIPDPGPDYSNFDSDAATIYKNEDVIALFNPDSGLDMKGMKIDKDYNLFTSEGYLLTRDFQRFHQYWKTRSDIDMYNDLSALAEDIYNYPSDFIGIDSHNNYYWQNFSSITVTNSKGQLLDHFLPDDVEKSKIRPAVHPNGDVYFLDYDKDWVYLYKIPNTRDPFNWQAPAAAESHPTARVNSGGLRVRDNPVTANSTVLGKLNLNQNVEILGQSADELTIDGLTAPWYKIRTSDGLEGWVFGGYLDLE